MSVELKVPSAGESITQVMIVEWRKNEGDYVEADETVVEIETDKASMDVPAPTAGILTQQLKQAGETAAVGDVLARFEPGPRPAGQAAPTQKPAAATGKPAAAPPRAAAGKSTAPTATRGDGEPRVMPAARRELAERGLRAADVTPTGPGGRLLKEDVVRHADAPAASAAPDTAAPASTAPPAADPAATDARREEVVPMTMLRRRVAERLVESQHTAAQLTTFNEVDMTAVLALRKQHNDAFERQYGIKLGFMSFFVKAAIDALQRLPAVNAEIRGTDIVYRNYYDIGVAVGTDKGLVVPVIRNAERLSFAQVEQAIADLARRARDRKLTIEELQGGTFTISNGGVYGSLLSTPILNPPQSGILGLHAIQDRPVARDGQVVIRPMMYVALTYDHRLIDGKEAVTFLKRIKECVEEPTRILLET